MQSVQCLTCKHYLGLGTCEAFPAGIPEEILVGTFDHSKEHEGDGGIRWEPVEEPEQDA